MTRIYFYRTSSGSVACKLTWDENESFEYDAGRGRDVRRNKGEDRNEYQLVVSLPYLNRFLDINGIDSEEVAIDPRSIDYFYSFQCGDEMKVSVSLTDRFIDEWWNCDVPNLYRHRVNKEGKRNIWGIKRLYFTNGLVEVSAHAVRIGDALTQEEVNRLIRGREENWVAREMLKALEARKLSESEIARLKDMVTQYEARIQEVIDRHASEIRESVADLKDGDYGPDSGFLYICTLNPEIMEAKTRLQNVPDIESRFAAHHLNLTMPVKSQSTTVLRKAFETLQWIVKRETGEDLYCQVVLD